MAKKNLRYVIDYNHLDKTEKVIFVFEVGMSLRNNKELHQELFEKVSNIMTSHNNEEIERGLERLADEGVCNIGYHVFSTEDVDGFIND